MHPASSTPDATTRQRLLALCGVVAPLLFVFTAALGGAMRPGYSHFAHTVSELLSPGAPNRLLLSVLSTAYALLMALFALGLLLFVGWSRGSTRTGTLGASLLLVAGLTTVAIATFFPQDPWGAAPTLPGEMHIILSGVIGVLQFLSILLIGTWSKRTRISPKLAAYSLLTAVAVALLAGFLVAMVNTPLMGLAERLSILVGLVWTLVVALWLLSRTSHPDWLRS